MKDPPAPLFPSGLAAHTAGNLHQELVIRCCSGWGWQIKAGGKTSGFEAVELVKSDITVIPESFIPFRSERGGIFGRVIHRPAGYAFTRFVAFPMHDGTDFDFEDHICQAWRVILADGELDLETGWFPLLTGDPCYMGYGCVALSAAHHDRLDQRHAI